MRENLGDFLESGFLTVQQVGIKQPLLLTHFKLLIHRFASKNQGNSSVYG